jgi:RNA polymerase sigma factor (sigma-70 family)
MQLVASVVTLLEAHTNIEMIIWTTVGAFFPEIIRLYKLRTRGLSVVSWRFYISWNVLFPLVVGPALAAAFEPANVLGAIYTGASANVLLAAICSSVLENEEGSSSMSKQHTQRNDVPEDLTELVRQAQAAKHAHDPNNPSLSELLAKTRLYAQVPVSRIVPYDHQEDVLQEVSTRVFETIEQCTPSYFRAWLAVVARRVALDYMRRHRNAFSELALDPSDDHIAELEQASDTGTLDIETLTDIQDMFLGLSPREREVFTLFIVFRYSYAEIAERLNIAELTVQTHLNRARTKLREKKPQLF